MVSVAKLSRKCVRRNVGGGYLERKYRENAPDATEEEDIWAKFKGNATDITFVEDIWSEIIGARARDTKFVEGIWSGIGGKMLLM